MYTRCARVSVAAIFCSTSTIVCPAAAKSRHALTRSRTTIGASPSNGSSSSRIWGFSDQRAGDRQHLLFAAREIGAPATAAILQAREHGVNPVERPGFLHVRLPERYCPRHSSSRRYGGPHVRVACRSWRACDWVVRRTGPRPAGLSRRRTDDAHQALQRRALARAIATQQSDDFASFHTQGHVKEGTGIPIIAVEAARPPENS